MKKKNTAWMFDEQIASFVHHFNIIKFRFLRHGNLFLKAFSIFFPEKLKKKACTKLDYS